MNHYITLEPNPDKFLMGCKLDLRLFIYLWPFIVNNEINRNFGSTDGISREYGEYFHRDNLDTYMCKDFYDGVCECPDFTEGETIIDCRAVSTSSYNHVGETIIGGLQNVYW